MLSKSMFRFRSLINRSPKDVFAWHLRARTWERSLPSWGQAKVISSEGRANHLGSKVVLNKKIFGPFWRKIEYEYACYVPNETIKAIQKKGFFTNYEYQITFVPQSNHTCEVTDQFQFSHNCPNIFSYFINRAFLKVPVRMLAYRHEIIDCDLGLLEKYPFKKPLKVLITGSHGMIGTNLLQFLEFAGHEVWRLSRSKENQESQTIVWDPQTGQADVGEFEDFDVVINLAGESVVKGLWTKSKKERILKSRYQGTENLVGILKKTKKPPKTFINASGVLYYGDSGNEVKNEKSFPGKGLFLTDVCQLCEKASKDLEEVGTRVIQTRLGMVLSSAGGGLKTLLFPLKCGLGGNKIGNGHQYINWITIDDVIGSLYHLMMTPSIEGPVNVVAPNPVPNRVFCEKLAKRLNRWKGPPLPEFLVRLFLQQKGEELFLTSMRAEPSRLIETGYTFQYPTLSQALEHIV